MKSASLFLSIAAVLALAGCSTLVPKNTAVAPAIPAQWPAEAAQGEVADVAAVGWRDFFTDARLQQVIDQSLQNNRDLRVAVLNVERARGQYRVQRADRVPGVAVTGQMQRQGTDAGVNEQFTAGVGVAEFELDLFGRVRNLSEAALQQYFAVAANRRNAQLSLVAETATAWLTYGADAQRLKIADATLKTYEDSLRLAEARHERGGSSALELTQTRTLVETARTDAARLRGQLAQDRNALALLAGGQLDPALLPDSIEPQLLALAPPPAGLPSDVLLQRPDIMAAEHQLLAANANIGAARAAFFPSISLTGSIGSGSSELSNLFDSGTRVWSFLPKITLPIFQGGKLRANLAIANADRDIALAQYEKSIQVGFRETADALALNVSLDEQVSSQQRLVEAAEQANRLSQARYDAGLDSFVTLLDARRTAYNAQQTQLQAQLAQQANRITLYKVMGGGWHERSWPALSFQDLLHRFIVAPRCMAGANARERIAGFARHLLVLGADLFQARFVQFFQIQQFVVGFGRRPDQLVQLDLHRGGVRVLRVLDQEHHQEGDDGGAGVDHQLPGVVETEHRATDAPDHHDRYCSQEGPRRAGGGRGLLGDRIEQVSYFHRRRPTQVTRMIGSGPCRRRAAAVRRACAAAAVPAGCAPDCSGRRAASNGRRIRGPGLHSVAA